MVKAVRANGTPVWYAVYDMGHEELDAGRDRLQPYAWVLFVAEVSAELTTCCRSAFSADPRSG